MFPRLILLAAIFNPAIVLPLSIPMLILTLICLIPAIVFMQKDTEKAPTQIPLGNPLNVWNALSFAFIYTLIIYAVFYVFVFFCYSGFFNFSLFDVLG